MGPVRAETPWFQGLEPALMGQGAESQKHTDGIQKAPAPRLVDLVGDMNQRERLKIS